MKNLLLILFVFAAPLVLPAQKTLSGLWTGTLSNDSTTIRKDQTYEIALTQYKDKVYGYSRMNFIVNDTLYYIVKRIKGSIENDVCEVKDDEIVKHNFPGQPHKGVKLISTFRRNQQDSIWRLDGDWRTTETKKHRYYAISGKIALASEPDYTKSKLLPHLEELKLDKDVEFYTMAKREAAKNEKKISLAAQKKESNPKDGSVYKKEIIPVASSAKQQKTITPGDKKEVNSSITKQEELIVKTAVPDSPPVAKQLGSTAEGNVDAKNIQPIELKPKTEKEIILANILGRKTVVKQEEVLIVGDSVVIALYDNGEIDGDSVSVLLNDEVIIAKQGLKASAIKKTIYLSSAIEENKLVLFAENLGRYPPNTGLLVIYDGDVRYQVRFSADLQQNAGIILKRKK